MPEKIYVDVLMDCMRSRQWRWPKSCHLFTEPGNIEALHEFARSIGLKREWFQPHSIMPHYDLNEARRAVAVTKGAQEVEREFVGAAIKRWRGK